MIHEDLSETQKELNATDNFIEKYLPFKMLNYIHDAMKQSLTAYQFGKVITHLDQTYGHLEYVAENDDGKARYSKQEY